MRDLLAHPRRCGLTALAAIVVALASAAVASGDPSGDALGGPPTANAPAISATIVVAQNGGPDENQTPATFAITTAGLPTPVLNRAYSQTITTSGGAAPIAFSVSALPGGLYLAADGIAGTPTAAGSYSFTIRAVDANGATATQTYSGTIAGGFATTGGFAITAASLPTPLLNQAYSQTITTSGGAAPIAVSVSTLPAGLYLADGAIAGTPTQAGDYSFTVRAADANGATATQTYSGTIAPASLVANPVSAAVGYDSANNAISLDIRGGAADRVSVSTQPAHGRVIASRTMVIYSPTRGYSGSDSFQYAAANASGESSPATVSITVNPEPPSARPVRMAVQANSTSNEINLNITGGPPDSVAVTAPATEGAATASGTSIAYTPGSDFAGLDRFQYTATNAGGTSQPATVFVMVRADAPVRAVSREARDPPLSRQARDPPPSREARNRCAAPDPDTSITGCTELIESGRFRATDLAIAYNNRGMAYDAERQYDKAISDFTSAIQTKSDVGAIYFNRGAAYDGKGQTDQAIADFSRAITLQPDDANAYIRRGKDYRGNGLADQAIADFTKAIRLRPSSADAYEDRAAAYGSKGAGDQAIADLSQAIALRPNFAQTYIDRGAVYMNRGLYDQSIADSTEAIALKPNDAGAYVNRAGAFIGKGLYDQAIDDATRAIALQPDNALAYNNRAVAYIRKTLFDQAISDSTQAIALEPDYALAYLNRGLAEDARGRRDQTIADLRAALAIDPTLQVARDGLKHLGVTP